MKKNKNISIIPGAGTKFLVHSWCTTKQLEKEWRGTISGFGGLTRDFLKESGIVLISFPNKKPKTEDVVHEFYHAVDLIMNYIGHKNSSSSDEPSAFVTLT